MAELFDLGRTVGTPGATDALEKAGITPQQLFERHVSGDWGETGKHDAALNDRAVKDGEDRIFSVYSLGSGADSQTVWVITEWDRSATTILLPSEY